jgi:Fe-S oxidoreductase
MAKMKVEFLHAFKTKHGYTLKDRLVAHLPDYVMWASRFAFLANLPRHVPGLVEKLTGFSAKRPLPRWRVDTFWRNRPASLFASRDEALAIAKAGGKATAIFVDTFNGNFEPENVLAAAKVLKAGGYAVYPVTKNYGQLCCGRTYLAAGMVEKAREKALTLVSELTPLAEAGMAIVGLEPSCLLTLRDEALALNLGEPAKKISKRAMLFEEFVALEAKAGRLAIKLKPVAAPILVHGHCHQKAFGTAPAILEILQLIPGAKPQMIETSCCGMAGSFGYDHPEISLQMAELSLLPAIRRQPDAIIIADGTSCRRQITDGARRKSLSAAHLLSELLV